MLCSLMGHSNTVIQHLAKTQQTDDCLVFAYSPCQQQFLKASVNNHNLRRNTECVCVQSNSAIERRAKQPNRSRGKVQRLGCCDLADRSPKPFSRFDRSQQQKKCYIGASSLNKYSSVIFPQMLLPNLWKQREQPVAWTWNTPLSRVIFVEYVVPKDGQQDQWVKFWVLLRARQEKLIFIMIEFSWSQTNSPQQQGCCVKPP